MNTDLNEIDERDTTEFANLSGCFKFLRVVAAVLISVLALYLTIK